MCFPDGGVSSRNRRRKRHYCGGTAAVRYPMTFSLCGIIRRGDRSAVYTFGVLSAAIVPGALSACAPEGARTFRSCGYPAKHVRGRIPPPGFLDTKLPRQRTHRYPDRAGPSRNGFHRRDFPGDFSEIPRSTSAAAARIFPSKYRVRHRKIKFPKK